MVGIPLELDDWWTQRQMTELRLKDRILSGAGISFDAWRRAFTFDDGSWYATIYGEYHDNFVAVSVDPSLRISTPNLVLSTDQMEAGNVSRLVESCGFQELTPELTHKLGFGSLDEISQNSLVEDTFFAHDNFIFAFPYARPRNMDPIDIVLGVHENYLHFELTPIFRLEAKRKVTDLLARRPLLLRSHAQKEYIEVTYSEPSSKRLKRFLKIPDKQRIILRSKQEGSF